MSTQKIIELFTQADELWKQRGTAWRKHEKVFRAMHPEPPPGLPWSQGYSQEEREEYARSHDACHQYYMRMMDLATNQSDAKDLLEKRNALVKEGLDLLGPLTKDRIVGEAPGGQPCPKCKAQGFSIPNIVDDKQCNAHSRMAFCTADSNHLIRWLPWGG